MNNLKQGHWFSSEKFEIQEGEDEETNPGLFGKSLAQYLAEKLANYGYETEVIAEDWGWCVMCQTDEYLLWVGCGSTLDEDSVDFSHHPRSSELTWYAFPFIEVPLVFIKSKFRQLTGKLDTNSPLIKLNSELESILSSDVEITICEEPNYPLDSEATDYNEYDQSKMTTNLGSGTKITLGLIACLSGIIMSLWASTAPGNIYFNSLPAAFCFVITGACILPKPISGYLGDVISVCVIILAVLFLIESLPNPKEGESPIGFAIIFGGGALTYLSRRYGGLIKRKPQS